MRANHSPLQFAGLIATASVLACGVCANAALARTMPSTTASNGASASAVLVGSSSAPETRTRTAVDSNRTSRALLSSPSAAPAGSATGGQHLVPVTSPAAPATPASPPPAGPSSRVDIAGTPLVGAGRPARAPTGANVPPATITTTAPTDPSPAASAAGTPRAIQLSAPPAPASRPAATQPDAAAPATSGPAATHPVATAPSGTRPPATPAVATEPVATEPVAAEPVAAEPVATQSPKGQSGPLSPGSRTRRLHQSQTLVTQRLRAEKAQAAWLVTPSDSPLSRAPGHPSRGLARGPLGPAMGSPRALAGGTEFERGSVSGGAAPRRPERAQRPPSVAPLRAAAPAPIPQARHRCRRFRRGCRSVARPRLAAVVSARSHRPSWLRSRRSLSRSRRSCWCASLSIVRCGGRRCSRRDSSIRADHRV